MFLKIKFDVRALDRLQSLWNWATRRKLLVGGNLRSWKWDMGAANFWPSEYLVGPFAFGTQRRRCSKDRVSLESWKIQRYGLEQAANYLLAAQSTCRCSTSSTLILVAHANVADAKVGRPSLREEAIACCCCAVKPYTSNTDKQDFYRTAWRKYREELVNAALHFRILA